MSSIDVARNFFTRMDARDMSGALALVTSHARINLVPLNLQGDAEVVGRQYFEQLTGAFPDLAVRVRRLFVGNDGTAVVQVSIEGTQAADFFGIINQEKFLDLDQVWFLHVTDGAIDRIKAYWCQNQLYRRLGVKRLDHVTITA